MSNDIFKVIGHQNSKIFKMDVGEWFSSSSGKQIYVKGKLRTLYDCG